MSDMHRRIFFLITLTAVSLGVFVLGAPTTFAWYNSSWLYRVAVTVDAAEVDADLTDFPVYVDLGDLPAGFHTHVNSDGSDIRVTTSDGATEVPREVVTYDAATDSGEIHFKGDLSNTTDTTFYIYYGNATATEPAVDATYGAENVWTNGYKGVWHMQDGTTLSAVDSTSNDNDGTISTPSATSGKIDGAGSFNGTSDRIILPRTTSLSQTTGWTLQAWTYATAAPQGPGVIAEAYAGAESSTNDSDVQYELGFGINEGPGGSSALKIGYYNGTWHTVTDPAGNATTNTWLSIAGSWNGTTLALYKNGSSVASSNPGSAVPTGAGKFFIGRRHDAAGSVNFFPGYIDEVRISSAARASTWISTEYNNQSAPSTFYAVGAEEEDVGAGTPARELRLRGGIRLNGGVRLRGA
jgi:hypothetical protein